MWNERYASEEYMYGTEPNAFLAEHAAMLKGPVLSLAEGEGRNTVFLASLGFEVLGVNSSDVGLDKAQALARQYPAMALSIGGKKPEAWWYFPA